MQHHNASTVAASKRELLHVAAACSWGIHCNKAHIIAPTYLVDNKENRQSCLHCLGLQKTQAARQYSKALTSHANAHFKQWCQQASKQDDRTKEGAVDSVVGGEALLSERRKEGQRTEVLLLLNLNTSGLILTLQAG
jgi:hypothetical protein